jgi:hypothetical protein
MFTVLQVLFEGFSLLEILVSELVGLLELLVPFVSLGILPVVVPVGDCKEPVFLLKGLLELPSLFLKLLLQILNVLIDLRAILGCLIALSAGGFVAGILEDIASAPAGTGPQSDDLCLCGELILLGLLVSGGGLL